MIIIFPMLVAPTIPEEFISPITKMLERYLLVNKLQVVFEVARNHTKKEAEDYINRVVKKVLKESEDILGESMRYDDAMIGCMLNEADVPKSVAVSQRELLKNPSGYDQSRLTKQKLNSIYDIKQKLELGIPLTHSQANTWEQFKKDEFARIESEKDIKFEDFKADAVRKAREHEMKEEVLKIDNEKLELEKKEQIMKKSAQAVQDLIKKEELDIKRKNYRQTQKEYKLAKEKFEADKSNQKAKLKMEEEANKLKRLDKKLEIAEKRIANKMKKEELQRKMEEFNLSKEKFKIESQKAMSQIKMDAKKMKEILIKIKRDASHVDVETLNMSNDMVLEPTFMKIKFADGDDILGVKVIPFYIKSGAGLINLLMNDIEIKGINERIEGIKRKIKGAVYRFLYKMRKTLTLGFMGSKPNVSGEVMHDIIYSASRYRDRIFVLLDRSEITPEFFQNAGNINKLFSLGWKSILFYDDVHKRVYFCMKQYKGLCNPISLPVMFSSLGNKENLYNSLEDARTATTPFFRTKISSKKIIGEGQMIIDQKVEAYRQAILDENIITDTIDKIKKISITKFFSDLFSTTKAADKEKEFDKIAKKYKNLPKIPDGIVQKIFSKADKDYNSNYNFIYKVLKNTFKDTNADFSEKELGEFSTMIASMSTLKAKAKRTNSKAESKKILMKVGDVISQLSPEQMAEIRKIMTLGVAIGGLAIIKKPLFDYLHNKQVIDYVMNQKEYDLNFAQLDANGSLPYQVGKLFIFLGIVLFTLIITLWLRGKNND